METHALCECSVFSISVNEPKTVQNNNVKNRQKRKRKAWGRDN